MYKIGTTSYIYPDEILPNVLKLKEKVDDIELLLFESGNIPSLDLINELRELSRQFNFTYTVHLPLDLKLADTNSDIRKSAIEKIIAIMEKIADLNPHSYILHVKRNGVSADLSEWQKQVRETVKRIIEGISISPSTICMENLNYPLELLDEIIAEFNLSVCLDIGHMLQYKFDIKKYFQKYIDKARVIHLYGIDNSGLHSSLKKVDTKIITWLKNYLSTVRYKGVVTLEVFSESDLKKSLEVMESISGRKEVRN